MNEINERALAALHYRLMNTIRSDEDTLGEELIGVIRNLGSYTQEVLMNARESAEPQETALSAACRMVKIGIIGELLGLQAVPTLTLYRQLMTNSAPRYRHPIARYLLHNTKRQQSQSVFWLACLHNEVETVSMLLKTRAADANATIIFDVDPLFQKTWPFLEKPTPIQYAAHRNFQTMVKLLETFTDHNRNAANDSYVDHLLIAAYSGHRTLAAAILERREANVEQYAQIYEIIGAAEIIANSAAVGKCAWKKAIIVLEASFRRKSRTTTDIICLEPPLQEFQTLHEIDAMRAKELRIQALHIMRKNFGNSYVFINALLKRDYSKKISVFALDLLLDTDSFSAATLRDVEKSLEPLSFFTHPDLPLVTKCLQWCVRAAGHVRSLLDIQPQSINDLSRLRQLVHFTCRILLSVELVEDNLSPESSPASGEELNHVLRRVISVFYPLNDKRCLLEQLRRAKDSQPPSVRDIFKILTNAGADLRVTDALGNFVADYTAE